MNKNVKVILTFLALLPATLLLVAAFAPYTISSSRTLVVESKVNLVYPNVENLENLSFYKTDHIRLKNSLKNESLELIESHLHSRLNFELVHTIDFRPQKHKTRIEWTTQSRSYFPLNVFNYFLKKEIEGKLEAEAKRLKKTFNKNKS